MRWNINMSAVQVIFLIRSNSLKRNSFVINTVESLPCENGKIRFQSCQSVFATANHISTQRRFTLSVYMRAECALLVVCVWIRYLPLVTRLMLIKARFRVWFTESLWWDYFEFDILAWGKLCVDDVKSCLLFTNVDQKLQPQFQLH
jgi:hypothetical protein